MSKFTKEDIDMFFNECKSLSIIDKYKDSRFTHIEINIRRDRGDHKIGCIEYYKNKKLFIIYPTVKLFYKQRDMGINGITNVTDENELYQTIIEYVIMHKLSK